MKTFSASASRDVYEYPYGAPDLPETPEETTRRVKIERAIEQDLEAHIADELAGAIRGGQLVSIPRSQLTEDEIRAAFNATFQPNY